MLQLIQAGVGKIKTVKILPILSLSFAINICMLSGVFALSWYPPGMADDEGKPFHALVFDMLDIAQKYDVKVGFIIS